MRVRRRCRGRVTTPRISLGGVRGKIPSEPSRGFRDAVTFPTNVLEAPVLYVDDTQTSEWTGSRGSTSPTTPGSDSHLVSLVPPTQEQTGHWWERGVAGTGVRGLG